jgi:hypothetical protein
LSGEGRVYSNHLFCRQCYEEGQKYICSFCNRPIFNDRQSVAIVRDIHLYAHFHSNHCVCIECGKEKPANSMRFNGGVLKCVECSRHCAKCGKRFDQGVKDLFFSGRHYHPACLSCQFCHRNLSDDLQASESRDSDIRVYNVRGQPCCYKDFKNQQVEGLIDERGHLVADAIEGEDEQELLHGSKKVKASGLKSGGMKTGVFKSKKSLKLQ